MSLLVDVLELLRPLLPSADTELTPDTELFSSQLLDSLALEEIQAAIESRWVPLPPEELTLANFNTPAAIAETIARTST
uniref:CcbZ n=1 Tax=Streptomyces caelestis TaxID=36816 RepID=UPI0026F37D8E|nr:Chain C, CcbZ [Streptomyces caelestis]7YN3_D Chain D, CcbZ [Streptomyces caelestis]